MARVVSLALLSLVAVLAAGCGSDDNGTAAPAPQAQTREAARLVTVVRGLSSPVAVATTSSRPGRLYVVEQGGTIRIVEGGKVRAGVFLDVRNRVVAGGEQGLLGLAFASEVTRTNHRFYVDYTDRNGDTNVVEYRANAAGTAAISVEREAAALRRPAVREPQRRQRGLRARRRAVRRHGRRRLRRRPGGPRAEHGFAARQAAADRRRPSGSRQDRRARPAEPVALLVRPRERRPLDRRRRPETRSRRSTGSPVRGSARLQNFGWDLFEGRSRFEDTPQGPAGSSARSPSTRTTTGARSPAASSTAARPCRRTSAATSTATTARARSGA